MQDRPDSFSVRLEVVPDCTCHAHGLVIRHAPDCQAFIPSLALTRDQVETLAAGLLAYHDRYAAPPGRRQRITLRKTEIIQDAVAYAEQLLGTEHRDGTW